MSHLTILWIIFWLVFVVVSAVDLFVITHRESPVGVKSALRWTALWVGVAFLFAGAIYLLHPNGSETAVLFVSGYLTEYSLSVDNLFVFVLIFEMMSVKPDAQPKLIKLGIYLSIVLRIVFIVVGVALVQRFDWMLYVFGVLLLWTAWKMLTADEDDKPHPEKNVFFRIGSRLLPVHRGEYDRRLALVVDGKWGVTTLFLAFLVIGSTDVLFAVDSIPAIMGISTDSFVVITSNIFAVLGLNSLFFAIRGVMNLFKYLKHGVSLILLFIGLKMVLPGIGKLLDSLGADALGHALEHGEEWMKARTWVSLLVIAALILGAMLASIFSDRRAERAAGGRD